MSAHRPQRNGDNMTSKRVLILCHDETFGLAAATWLSEAGHDVNRTADAGNAAAFIDARAPDIFITDEVVPSNGARASILRVGQDHPHVKIVALCRNPATESGLARAMGAVVLPAERPSRQQLLGCVDA